MILSVLFLVQIMHLIYSIIYTCFNVYCLTFAVILVGAVYGLFVNVNPMATIFPVLWIMMFISELIPRDIHGITQAMPIYQIQRRL